MTNLYLSIRHIGHIMYNSLLHMTNTGYSMHSYKIKMIY